jgi:anti-sigma B factor antagonist
MAGEVVAVVQLAGKITISEGTGELRECVSGLLERGTRHLVLDLSGLSYVDSAALGEIVAARRRAGARGGQIVLAGPSGKVRDLVELTRLDALVDIRDDVDSALAALDAD